MASLTCLPACKALAQPKPAAPPPAQAAPAPAAAAPAPKQVSTQKLLANPILGNESIKYLFIRRRELAGGQLDIGAFRDLAEEFAGKGALYSAVELLWFAEKMTGDGAERAAFQKRMREWLKAAEPTDRLVAEGEQLFAAGKPDEAIQRFQAALDKNLYCEKAHYNLANVRFLAQLRADEDPTKLPPLDGRTHVFRSIYESLSSAIAIDPIYYDAYYLLSTAREVIPDDPGFLADSQPLTDRALSFRNAVLPPMDKIEAGAREPELFHALGEAFEEVAVMDYAVFAYKTALARGSSNPKTRERLNALVEKYFHPKAEPAAAAKPPADAPKPAPAATQPPPDKKAPPAKKKK